MNDFNRNLAAEFADPEYRRAYAEDFLDTTIAAQLQSLREQRGLTQQQLADSLGMSQPEISRLENVNYSGWTVRTLKELAHGLGVRLNVTFETFGSLLEEAASFSRESLQRPLFEHDPLLQEALRQSESAAPPQPAQTLAEALDADSWLQRELMAWLDRPEEGTARLVGWMQGYEMPGGGEEEPWMTVLRLLPVGAERSAARKKLALRIASLLAEEPDVTRPGRRPEELLVNLFALAAGLDSPDELAEPVKQVYLRLKEGKSNLTLRERDALRGALVYNQIDDSLASVWREMLEQKHSLLPGTLMHGFEGVLRKPASSSTRGKPDMKAINIALLTIRYQWAGELGDDSGVLLCRRMEELYLRVSRVYEQFSKRQVLGMVITENQSAELDTMYGLPAGISAAFVMNARARDLQRCGALPECA